MKSTVILLFFTVVAFVNEYAVGQTASLPVEFGSHRWTAIVNVMGEDGNPIVGADVAISYTFQPPPSGLDQPRYGEVKGVTDINGVFNASHTDSSWDLGVVVKKSGFYTTQVGHQFYFDEKNRHPTFTLLLKKIGKPIAMDAKKIDSLTVPELNKAIGYDLTVGDWIAPYGKGIVVDLFFTQSHTTPQSGYILSVSFPKTGDGIQEFTVPNNEKGSGLRSPHEAPIDGYQPELTQTKMTDPNRNFYFRVRTVLDENGNVKSALYGKIYGDLAQFSYYLNPTPNSRNIEFDSKQNLLGALQSFERVNAP